ncbi:hypothetical protein HU200_011363 [Digitaria exilis]|uniref:BTB domain-containing protein n=1 Tax=Digitaria exilis TaxID=1010633 RepID=A0A835FGI1_9POAL|nr:hypothetical protein HU200_011363 [Digitaria exilis]
MSFAVGSGSDGEPLSSSAIVAEAVTGSHVLKIEGYSLIKGLGIGKFLFGPMKENTMNFIRIDDMDARVFKAMLHFIYTDTMADIDKEDVLVMTQHLLVAADRYDLERLKLICEDKLCEYIDTSTVAATLALAEQHGCHGLKKACFNFLKSPSHLKEAMANEGFQHLMSSCPFVIMELLAKIEHCGVCDSGGLAEAVTGGTP